MLSLMILLLTLTGTTYAWFKINSNATVSGFNFTVTGGEGYQISLNGDEDSYSDHLTSEDMRKAILCGYNSNYTVKNKKLYLNGSEISDSAAKDTIKKQIKLLPVTPRTNADGTFTFENQYGQPIQSTSGNYIEFSLYIKANGGKTDNNGRPHEYELYLLGSDEKDVVTNSNDMITLSQTSIRSLDKNVIQLKNKMRTHRVDLNKGDTIEVYTSNALRFSIGDDYQTLGKDQDKHTNQIFEISDDKEHDLGSYATTYKKEDDTSSLSETQKQELDDMYNADENAMFTYYNNIRPYNKLTKMNYADKPNTITHLVTQDEIKAGAEPYKFVSLKSGADNPNKVTFRFWLEGWDADCFDGISQSIRVNLSFSSFKNGVMTKIR